MNLPYRFSLRACVVVVAVIAVLLAWFVQPSVGLPRRTGRDLDVAIIGAGMFAIRRPDGSMCYTRTGNIGINRDGTFCLGRPVDGWELDPLICVPDSWTTIQVTPEGAVSAKLGNQPVPTSLGQIQLAKFINPEGLVSIYPGVYAETEASGPPTLCVPGSGGAGLLKQGWLQDDSPWSPDTQSLLVFAVLAMSAWTVFEVRRLHKRLDRLAT